MRDIPIVAVVLPKHPTRPAQHFYEPLPRQAQSRVRAPPEARHQRRAKATSTRIPGTSPRDQPKTISSFLQFTGAGFKFRTVGTDVIEVPFRTVVSFFSTVGGVSVVQFFLVHLVLQLYSTTPRREARTGNSPILQPLPLCSDG